MNDYEIDNNGTVDGWTKTDMGVYESEQWVVVTDDETGEQWQANVEVSYQVDGRSCEAMAVNWTDQPYDYDEIDALEDEMKERAAADAADSFPHEVTR